MNISIRPEEIDLITNASMFESLVNAVVTANDTNHDLVDKLLDGCFGAVDIEIDCPCQGSRDQTDDPDDPNTEGSENATSDHDATPKDATDEKIDAKTTDDAAKNGIPRVDGADPSTPEYQGTCGTPVTDQVKDGESPAEKQLHGMHDTDSATPGVNLRKEPAPNQEVRREASPELYEELFSALWAMYNAGDCTDYVGLSDISPEAEARLLRFLTAKAKLPEAVKSRLFPAK